MANGVWHEQGTEYAISHQLFAIRSYLVNRMFKMALFSPAQPRRVCTRLLPGLARSEVHGAMKKERQDCARRRAGEPAVS